MSRALKEIDGRVILYPCLIFLSILLLLFNNLYCFVTINVVLVFLLVFLMKYDMKNPALLWTTIFILYQISYPILNSLGIKVFEFCSLNSHYYLFSWVATVSFLVFYGSFKNVSYSNHKIKMELNTYFLKILYAVLLLLCIGSSLYIIANGYQSKYELASSSNIILSIGNMAYIALGILPMFFAFSDKTSRKEKIAIAIITFLIMLLGMFTYGERSYVFNYILVMMICYSVLRRVTIKKLAFIVVSVVLFFSVSSSLKMLFTSTSYSNSSNSNEGIIVSFLNSDFASAGFNFNYLLNKDAGGVLGGRSYVYDLLSPLDGVIDLSSFSSTKWYTNQYWGTRKTGLGFSIIGEGYVNFGFFGIVLQMAIIARMLKYFYLRSSKNGYYFIIYTGLLALSAYSCRQAVGNIISPGVKYYVLMTFLILFVNKLIVSKKASV